MILYPNAKINIGLNILNKREDGYHEISSIFYPVLTLFDILEVKAASKFSCRTTGNYIITERDNLCSKAFFMLHQDFNIPNVTIHLHKQIPVGSGLGGGSSDAVFTLKALNDIFNLELDKNQLYYYASKLGADCPFFMQNIPQYAQGIGDELFSLDLNLDEYEIRFIHSKIHISSSMSYKNIKVRNFKNNLKELIQKPIVLWRDNIINDFEYFAFKIHPELLEYKNQLYKEGAIYASLTGSGSTVYGIFPR